MPVHLTIYIGIFSLNIKKNWVKTHAFPCPIIPLRKCLMKRKGPLKKIRHRSLINYRRFLIKGASATINGYYLPGDP